MSNYKFNKKSKNNEQTNEEQQQAKLGECKAAIGEKQLTGTILSHPKATQVTS